MATPACDRQQHHGHRHRGHAGPHAQQGLFGVTRAQRVAREARRGHGPREHRVAQRCLGLRQPHVLLQVQHAPVVHHAFGRHAGEDQQPDHQQQPARPGKVHLWVVTGATGRHRQQAACGEDGHQRQHQAHGRQLQPG
jgi:hypothetical protein